MSRMTELTLLTGVAALLLAAPSAFAQNPDPASTYIESFSYAGAGCPAGTVADNLSEDRDALTLIFSQFAVEGGAAIGRPNAAIACDLRMSVHVPNGYSFSIIEVDTRGYAQVEGNSAAYSRTAFHWGNSPVALTQLSQDNLAGPYDNNFQATTTVRSDALTWSPCTGSSQPLTLNSTIGVTGAHAFINVDSIDTSFTTQYKLQWRPCTDPGAGFPIGRLGTQGSVARNTSMCLNFRAGTMTVSSAAPVQPGRPFAELTHYATAVTGQTRNVARNSAQPGRLDIYQLPGDWNNIVGLNPQVTATRVQGGGQPATSVTASDANTICVNVMNQPAKVAIRWNPIQG